MPEHKSCLLAIAFYTMCCGSRLFAQCGNADFEAGNFTGWTARSGCFQSVAGVPTVTMNATGVNATRHVVTSGLGFDPIVPSIPVVSPYGGTHSVKLGNSNVGYGAERLSYTFNVDPNNALFTYQYAVIFQDPTNGSHTDAERPALDVQIRSGITGDTINCGYYHVISHANLPGFQLAGAVTGGNGNATNGCSTVGGTVAGTANQDVWYKNWTLVAIDLTPYIGSSITIDFTTKDCSQGGHFGYAYLDAYCSPLQISGHFCPGDPGTTLTAPPGFSGYLWSTGATTQSIVMSNPVQGDTLRVTCIPFQGGTACATTLYYVFEMSPTVNVDFNVSSLCAADTVQFADISSVASGGGNINSWKWFVDGVLVDTTSAMNYFFPGAGNYTVTLISSSDAGCPDTLNREITVPPKLAAADGNADSSGISCYGGNDGWAAIHVYSGSPPYTYNWNTGATTDSIYGLNAGTYSVEVVDSMGCQLLDTITLSQPPPLILAPVSKNITCFGGTDGKIRLNASGGVPSYSYNWAFNPLLNLDSVVGLRAGFYPVTITDANGCTIDTAFQLIQPADSFQIAYTYTDVSCYGSNDGSIAITSTAGNTPGYTYRWNTSPVQTTTALSGLSFGTYSCEITDSRDCSITISQVIAQPPQLLVDLPKTDVRCYGESSGSITAVAHGGIFPYQYSWSTGAADYAIPNIPIGNYSVTVTDNHLCTASANMEIIQPQQLTVAVSSVDEKCFGGHSARAIAQPAGGSPPYYYVWNTEQSQQQPIAVNLYAGTYSITITDSHACTVTDTTTISEPPPLSVVITGFTDNFCFGGHAGTATAVASGGTQPYSYRWNSVPPQTTDSATGLSAGTYRVQVIDSELCVANAVVEIKQPPAIVATYKAEPAMCYDSAQGSIAVFLHNGTPAYTYAWSPNVSSSDSARNLVSGNYAVTITDAVGCTQTLTNMFVPQPQQLVLNVVSSNPVCLGDTTRGSITVRTTGGTPQYGYRLWENDSMLLANISGEFLNLNTGNYTVQITDNNNCVIAQAVEIAAATSIEVSYFADSVNCYNYNDGSITLSASGGNPPYQYSLNNGQAQNTWGLFTNLPAGKYSVHVADFNHCALDTTVFVNQPQPIGLYAIPDSLIVLLGENGTITLQSNYSGSDIWYQWSPDYGLDCSTCSEVTVSAVNNGFYTVHATIHPHHLDCTEDIQIPITVVPNYSVYVPTAFSPNNNGANDFYEIFGYDKSSWLEMKFQIFNRWGELVYESRDPYFKWNGYFKGELLQPMVLIWKLELTFTDGHSNPMQKGSLTLIR